MSRFAWLSSIHERSVFDVGKGPRQRTRSGVIRLEKIESRRKFSNRRIRLKQKFSLSPDKASQRMGTGAFSSHALTSA